MKKNHFAKVISASFIVLFMLAIFPAAPVQAADTGFNSPATCTSPGGAWFNPGNAVTADNSYTTSNANNELLTCTFNLPAIPPGSIIDGIEVTVEGFTTGRDINVLLSWDGSGNYTTPIGLNFGGAPDQNLTAGGIGNNWGRAWTSGEFTNANFRVRIASLNNSGGNTFSLDSLQVRVTYHAPATFTINASAGAGGTITPSGAVAVTEATNSTFTVTPSSTFIVQDVSVDSVSQGRLNSYTFTNVTANHTIAASFNGGWSQPAQNTGGGWTNEANAYASDNNYAVANGGGDQTEFYTFGLTVPACSSIQGIEVA